MTGDEACMRLFLDKGADPNIPGYRGYTPLGTAVANSSLEIMELLVSYGANLHGQRDLFLSTFRREHDAVAATKFILEHGVDANAHTRYGPPLHVAAEYGEEEMVQCLLD